MTRHRPKTALLLPVLREKAGKRALLLILLIAAGGWVRDESSPPVQAVPPILKDVGIDQKLGAQLPLDTHFRDESGNDITLRDCFRGRPVILTLVYYKCPALCTLVLNDLTRAMNALSETCGKDFDIVTISFNPDETPDLASDKKRQYLRAYRRPSAEQNWHFLTGSPGSIKTITQAVGFRYVYDAKQQQYIHASGLVVASPGGKLSRYFYGVEYAPKDLRLALIDANAGKTSSPTATILFYCFKYDATTGRYSLAIMRLLRIFAAVTILMLGTFMLVMFRRDRKVTA
jgi:protein SCO1